jgi:ribosome-binding protein aMBF1 (putative translation factor)
MSINYQDWTPVVFHKKRDDTLKQEQKVVISQRQSNQSRTLLENQESFQQIRFEKDYIQKVIQARVARKWSQKDLAMALKENVARINAFEQGKEVYDGKFKDRINRVLFSAGK